MADLKYLNRLSRDYPNIKAASAEIINLKAILALPKGTEYFLSDLHGEHEAFIHMLKSASGTIKMKISKMRALQIQRQMRKRKLPDARTVKLILMIGVLQQYIA